MNWVITHTGPKQKRSVPPGVTTYPSRRDALIAMRERTWEDVELARRAVADAKPMVHDPRFLERAERSLSVANAVLWKIDGLLRKEIRH